MYQEYDSWSVESLHFLGARCGGGSSGWEWSRRGWGSMNSDGIRQGGEGSRKHNLQGDI